MLGSFGRGIVMRMTEHSPRRHAYIILVEFSPGLHRASVIDKMKWDLWDENYPSDKPKAQQRLMAIMKRRSEQLLDIKKLNGMV